MNGTEKQISYAKSLIAKTIKQAGESLTFKTSNHQQDIEDTKTLNWVIKSLSSFDGDAGVLIETLSSINPQDIWNNKEFWVRKNGGKKFWALIGEEQIEVVEEFEAVEEFEVVENNELDRMVFSVVDNDGVTINYGHFTDNEDAVYVCGKMNTGEFNGDYISNLCQACKSCTYEA